jgi:hypothetical protein
VENKTDDQVVEEEDLALFFGEGDDLDFEEMKKGLISFPHFTAVANPDMRDNRPFSENSTCIVTRQGTSCWEQVIKGWKETLSAVS